MTKYEGMSFQEVVDHALQEFGPLTRCKLDIVDGCINVQSLAGDTIVSLVWLDKAGTERAWLGLSAAFRNRDIVVATSEAAWDRIKGLEEPVPGVVIGKDRIQIVDGQGRICGWDFDDLKDKDLIRRVIGVVAHTGRNGPGCIREMASIIESVYDVNKSHTTKIREQDID